MGVEGSASDDEIIKAVEEAGYGASSAELKSEKKEKKLETSVANALNMC